MSSATSQRNLFKRQLASQLFAQHHHPGHPEEDEVTSCFQNGVGVELFQVFCLWIESDQSVSTYQYTAILWCLAPFMRMDFEVKYLLGPAEHSEWKKTRREPGIKHIWI